MASEIVRGMSRNRRALIIGIITVAVVTGFVMRSRMSADDPQGQVLKVGAILPQTGAGAVFAQYIEEGIDLAVEEINANEQTQVKVLYEDSKNQPREGVSAYNKLVSTENPPVVIVALSSVAKALAPLAAQSKTTQVYIAVAIPDITDGQHTFRVYPEALGIAEVIAKYNAEKFAAKTSAVIYVNDEYGRVSLEAYKKRFGESGGSVVFAESYELQQTDFRAQISKLKEISPPPDVIYLCGYGPAYGTVVRQLKEQQVSSRLTADMTMGLSDTIRQIGEAAEGVFFVDGKVSPDFIRKFHSRYDREPSSYAGYAYDIIHLLHRTAKDKRTFTSDTVRDGLRKVENYPGAMGNITIWQNGNSTFEFVVKRIEGQKVKVVE
jgi:branched-chain amino acid transport system substrate-binding protein